MAYVHKAISCRRSLEESEYGFIPSLVPGPFLDELVYLVLFPELQNPVLNV